MLPEFDVTVKCSAYECEKLIEYELISYFINIHDMDMYCW